MSINQLERTNRRKLTFRRIVLSQYSDIEKVVGVATLLPSITSSGT